MTAGERIMLKKNELAIIVNPNAGNKKGANIWPEIKRILRKEQLNYTFEFTKLQGGAKEVCQQFIKKGYRKIIAVGGDGTLNEMVNGIFDQTEIPTEEFTIGIIPVGTGNDWCRTFGVPVSAQGAITIIKNKNTSMQDIGRIRQKDKNDRYFANVAGGGFDAFVAKRVNLAKEKGNGSPWIYLYLLLSSLFKYKSTSINLNIDGVTFEDVLLSFSIGIGKYNGGGMKQLPNAVHNDGLFDITVIRRMNKIEIIKNIKKLFDGTHIYLDKIELFQGKRIEVSGIPNADIEIDGESSGFSPATFEIIPRSLNVYCGNIK